jgi:phospholipid/cholesterol/gamma-HCH transport system substrate-binding protein
MLPRRIVVNVIFFFVLSVGLIAGLVLTIFRVQPKYTVDAVFADSGGVFTGQEVTYRGVTVGRVGDLSVVREGVRIGLVVERKYDRIPRDARARVMFKSAVGEQFVDLLPQSSAGPYLRGGDTIPIDRTELPIQQEDLLRLLDAVLQGIPPEAIHRLVDTAGTGLGGRGDELHLALAALDPITAVLARRAPELNRIAVNGDRVGTAFDRTAADFARGASSLAITADALGRGAPDLARVLREGSLTAPELASLIAARKSQLNTTIAGLADITRISASRIRSIDATLKWLPLFLDATTKAYVGGASNYLRFGLVNDRPENPPCDYNTPRHPITKTGDSPNQPVTGNFAGPAALPPNCPAAAPPSGVSSSARGASPDGTAGRAPSGPALPPGVDGWLRLVTDLLPKKP